jgi:hypothetical protein
MSPVPLMEDAEIRKLALDIVEDKVFHSNMIDESENVTMQMVFMPLLFLKEDTVEITDIGLLYEYNDKAGVRGINGYPVFSSMRMVHKDNTDTLQSYITELLEMRKKFMSVEEKEETPLDNEPKSD